MLTIKRGCVSVTCKAVLALLVTASLALPAWTNSPITLKQWNSDQIEWLEYSEGLTEARTTDRKVLVVFHATWCPHCQNYREQFFDETVVNLAKDMVMVMVDVDAEPHLNGHYGDYGTFIPRTMVLSKFGKHLVDIRGPYEDRDYWFFLPTKEPDSLIQFLRDAVAFTE